MVAGPVLIYSDPTVYNIPVGIPVAAAPLNNVSENDNGIYTYYITDNEGCVFGPYTAETHCDPLPCTGYLQHYSGTSFIANPPSMPGIVLNYAAWSSSQPPGSGMNWSSNNTQSPDCSDLSQYWGNPNGGGDAMWL